MGWPTPELSLRRAACAFASLPVLSFATVAGAVCPQIVSGVRFITLAPAPPDGFGSIAYLPYQIRSVGQAGPESLLSPHLQFL